MTIERKIRSVGTKSTTYPWLRRHVVIGTYNRHLRRDAAASLLVALFDAAADRAAKRRSKVKPKQR